MNYSNSHGKHYNADSSFYYGKQWQCVEFIKRYYFDHLRFKMPNDMGNAKDFFDPDVKQGELNKLRGLLQYRNDDNEPPAIDDILIFDGKYGHVGIVTKVTETEIEIIQQNIYMSPFETFPLMKGNGKYSVEGPKKRPVAWLRIPKKNVPQL
jgi:surface antigen